MESPRISGFIAPTPHYRSQFGTTSRAAHAQEVHERQSAWQAIQRKNHAIAAAAADARSRAKPYATPQPSHQQLQKQAAMDRLAAEAERARIHARPSTAPVAKGWNAGPGTSADAASSGRLERVAENARRRRLLSATRDELQTSEWRTAQLKQLRCAPDHGAHPETYGMPSRAGNQMRPRSVSGTLRGSGTPRASANGLHGSGVLHRDTAAALRDRERSQRQRQREVM